MNPEHPRHLTGRPARVRYAVRPSFGYLVLACTLFAVSAVGITGGVLLKGVQTTVTDGVASKQARILQGRAHVLAEEIAHLEIGLAALAQAEGVDLADDDLGPEKRALALAATEFAPFPIAAALLDRSGRVLWSEPSAGATAPADGAALVARAIASQRSGVTVVREAIEVTVPVAHRGAIVGVVRVRGADLLGGRLASLLGHEGSVALVRRDAEGEMVVAEAGAPAPAAPRLDAAGQRWLDDGAGRRWLVSEAEVTEGAAPLVLRLVQAAPELEREGFTRLRRLVWTLATALLLAAVGGALLALALRRLEGARFEVVKARDLAAMGKTALSVAHEVKNSINGLSVALDLLASRHTGEETAGVVHAQARQEISRLRDVADDLTLFSAQPQLDLRSADVNALCRSAVAQAAGLAADCGAHVELALSPEPLLVAADPLKLLGAIQNLVRNGLEAMGPGAYGESLGSAPPLRERRLVVAARRRGGGAIVEVADTGCGLAPEVRQRLFEPFVTTKRTGTGLGLAIVRRVVEAHGGAVHAEARPGGGTVFRITLPGAGAAAAHGEPSAGEAGLAVS